MNRLFEDVQTSPLKLAGVQAVAGRDRTGEQRCGMFCDARVLKVTDWVMWGIFAYWPSWSVSVNKELKPLYISPRTIPLSVSLAVSGDIDGLRKTSFFIFWTQVQFPLPIIGIVSCITFPHHSNYIFVFALNMGPSDPSASAHYRC